MLKIVEKPWQSPRDRVWQRMTYTSEGYEHAHRNSGESCAGDIVGLVEEKPHVVCGSSDLSTPVSVQENN